METLDFTVGLSQHDNQNEGLKNHIMKEEKEYIEKQEIICELREAIFEGIESGIDDNFKPKLHLEALKREFKNV